MARFGNFWRAWARFRGMTISPRGGGELLYETDGDARRLAKGCKFWILVSLRVFRAKRQYFKPPRSRLGFREALEIYDNAFKLLLLDKSIR